MYRVLLVDDEHNYCTYLKSLFDWESLGCLIPEAVYSGQEALNMIGSKPVDIVFTDMNMPGMDGVELIRRSHESGRFPAFIALSGFEDFEYVRESLKNGAVDYLLKHTLNEAVLREALQNAFRHVAVPPAGKEDIPESYKNQMAGEIYKELLLRGCTDKELMERELQKTGYLFTKEGSLLLLLQINDYGALSAGWQEERQKQRFPAMVLDICRNALSDHGGGLALQADGSFALVFGISGKTSRLYMLETLRQLAGRIAGGIKRMLNAGSRFAVGDPCYDIGRLNEEYLRTLDKFKARFYWEKETMYMKTPSPFTETHTDRIQEQEIRQLVFAQNRVGIEERLDGLFETYKKQNLKPAAVKEEMITLCSAGIAIAKNGHILPEELYAGGMSCFTQLQFCETAGQMKDTALRLYCSLLDRIEAQKYRENCSDATQKALTYISLHYGENISLDEVSEHIGINSAYLSRLFKRDIGKGFVEFLNEYRVEKAKELISQDVRLKEIVGRTGFSSYNYFFKVFKEVTRMTPQEYKREECEKKY